MSDPLQSASFKRFSKLLDIIFDHEDEMVPENFKLGKKSAALLEELCIVQILVIRIFSTEDNPTKLFIIITINRVFPAGAEEEEDCESAPETLLSLRKLELLSAEAAKLKQMRVLNCIPQDRLVRLLNILDRHIRDTIRLYLNPEPVSGFLVKVSSNPSMAINQSSAKYTMQ